ncbi:hypothetical protein [Nonomuraea monospora]
MQMHRSARLLAVIALATVGLFATAPAASAVVDPVRAGDCLASRAGEVSTSVDPSLKGLPVELTAVSCLASP